MKKTILTLLCSAALSVSYADDSMKASVKPKEVSAPAAKAGGPVDRELELRIGPRISFLTGDMRLGNAVSTEFDIWDDLRLDNPNGGIQFDVDWQPVKDWHLDFGMTWDRYDNRGITTKTIQTRSVGAGLVAGSTVDADLDLYTFEGAVGYDLYKDKTVRVRPYVGGKAYVVDGRVTITNNGPGGSGASRTYRGDRTEGTYLVGADVRFYPSKDWYLGGDLGGSGWDEYYLLTGDAYVGLDLSQDWGIRFGYAFDYVDYENKNKTTRATPLLGAVYLQGVWGF